MKKSLASNPLAPLTDNVSLRNISSLRSFLITAHPLVTLGSLLSENQVIPNMQATERWQAIEEIVLFLIQGGYLKEEDKAEVLGALCQREETMSTGIGFNVAVPHASTNAIDRVIVAFGRSQTGIEFESLDGKPVYFIVLFLVPSHQLQTHLKTLSAVAKFFNNRFLREELMNASGAEAIMEIFNRSIEAAS